MSSTLIATTTPVSPVTGLRARRKIVHAVIWVGLFAALIVILIPMLWAVLGSFKTEVEYRQIPVTLVPHTWTVESYAQVIAKTNLLRGYGNSTLVATIQILGVVLSSSLAGYVFSQKQFPGKNVLFLFVLGSTMIPFTMLLIPLYLLFTRVGLQNTYLGIVLPSLVSPYGIFLCRQFIGGIPRDLFDAAKADGASDILIYRHIVLQLSKPVITALAVFTMIQSFNDLIWPLVVINVQEMETLPLVLARITLVGEYIVYTEFLAAIVLASLPLVIIFLILHRNFVKGIALTGIVG